MLAGKKLLCSCSHIDTRIIIKVREQIHWFVDPVHVYYECVEIMFYSIVLQVRCFVSGILGLPVINCLGWQASTVLGAGLSFVGLLCSSYVQSFYLIYLTFGIITGEYKGHIFSLLRTVIYP